MDIFMEKNNKKSVFLICFLLLMTGLFGDNFRVAKLKSIEIPEDYSPVTVNVGLNEGLFLKIPKDKTFIQGFEFEIKIPKIVATYRDSVIYTFYSDVSPEPKENLIDYSGKKLMVDTIPPRLSINLQTFFENNTKTQNSPYSTLLPFTLSENQENLAIRFQMAMKGVPESFFSSEFSITIKPILKDEGLLSINLIYPETEKETETDISVAKGNISLFIDDNVISDYSKPILLKTGTHHISVVSEDYRNEVRTIIINQASNSVLDIELKSISPELTIVAPANTKVFLDDVELVTFSDNISISPGEHTVKFVIGDYELTKTVFIQNGKSYEVSLLVDINVLESSN